MTDKKTDEPEVTRFYVENPAWTYGKKLVVLATDYDRLAAEHTALKRRAEQLQERCDEWERAARIARERNSGRITLVKATPSHDARGLPVSPTTLGGSPYKP